MPWVISMKKPVELEMQALTEPMRELTNNITTGSHINKPTDPLVILDTIYDLLNRKGLGQKWVSAEEVFKELQQRGDVTFAHVKTTLDQWVEQKFVCNINGQHKDGMDGITLTSGRYIMTE